MFWQCGHAILLFFVCIVGLVPCVLKEGEGEMKFCLCSAAWDGLPKVEEP